MRSLAALRRQLLTRPGFSAKPICPRCRREVEPRAFGQAACRECEAAVTFADNRIQAIDRRLAELWGASREGFGSVEMDDEIWQLECERQDLHVTLHPEECSTVEPKMYDTEAAGRPFLPDDAP